MSQLILTESGKREEKVFPLHEKIRIGRNADNDVALGGAGISREHAEIILEDDQHYLVDLGSGNGTLLNGLAVKAHEKVPLKNNDRITLSHYSLRFLTTDELFEASLQEEEEVTDADILEVKLLKKVLDAVDQDTVPSLEVLNGCAEGKRHFLSGDTEEIVIGRDPSADFVITEDVISRNHARIAKRWEGITLIDLESKNGSYVNNRRITEEVLHDGDRIALGTIVLLFRNPKEINIKEMGDDIIRKRPAPPVHKEEGTPEQATKDILEEIPEWQPSAANAYPTPFSGGRKLSPLEIGMIGLGIVVLSFAVITLVNLVLE